MEDSFWKTENSFPSNVVENVEFDLCFESDMLPYKYATRGGERYEQSGSLEGEIRIGENTVNFSGRGIRDHSWGIRNIPEWGEYYALMGRFGLGALSCAYMDIGSSQFSQGWVKKDRCSKINTVQVDPVYSGDVLKTCHLTVETAFDRIDIDCVPLSFVTISMGEEQEKVKAREILMELTVDKAPGHGFLWCRG